MAPVAQRCEESDDFGVLDRVQSVLGQQKMPGTIEGFPGREMGVSQRLYKL